MKSLKSLIIALVASCASFTAMAQDVDNSWSFCYSDGTLIPNGSTVTTNFYKVSEFDEFMIPTHLYVKNTTDAAAYLKITYNVREMPNGAFKYCFPGTCQVANTTGLFTSQNGGGPAGSVHDTQSEWIPASQGAASYGTCSVLASITVLSINSGFPPTYDVIGQGHSITINMVYDASSTAINGLNGDKADIILDGNSIRGIGSFESLTVFTLDGKMVSEDNLKTGVYVARMIAGKNSLVKKIYVK